jgi:hypothetical protein
MHTHSRKQKLGSYRTLFKARNASIKGTEASVPAKIREFLKNLVWSQSDAKNFRGIGGITINGAALAIRAPATRISAINERGARHYRRLSASAGTLLLDEQSNFG